MLAGLGFPNSRFFWLLVHFKALNLQNWKIDFPYSIQFSVEVVGSVSFKTSNVFPTFARKCIFKSAIFPKLI